MRADAVAVFNWHCKVQVTPLVVISLNRCIPANQFKMNKERMYILSLIVAILVMYEPVDGKKVIIHVPFRVKKIKHTHTIYKVIPQHHRHSEKKDDHVDDSEEFDHYKK